MKAAILHEFRGTVGVEVIDDPLCVADGVVVEVGACGVCRSDHHAWSGVDPDVKLPHVMGHEFAGTVVEVGRDVRRFVVGDRVTAPFILGCGTCAVCDAGRATTCPNQEVVGFTTQGAFAERIAVRRADFNLVALPHEIDFVDAAAMGCRVTTAWRAVKDRGQIQPGEWLVVHGAGGVGLSALLLASALGAATVAVDISPGALELATQLGVDVSINAADLDDVGAAVREATGGGAHVSIDALGAAATFENSLRSLRPLGRHIQVGMPVQHDAVLPLPLLELVYGRELTIHGMRGLQASGFPALLDLLGSGTLDLGVLVTRRLRLSEIDEVLREMDGAQQPGIAVVDRLDC